MKLRASIAAVSVFVACLAQTCTAQADRGGGSGSSGSTCTIAPNLTILQPSSQTLSAQNQLSLYCPGTGTNGRNGQPAQVAPDTTPTGECAIDTGWEEAQVLGLPSTSEVSGASGSGVGDLQTFPIAFWSGTTDAVFVSTETDTFYSGSDTTLAPGGNWTTDLSRYPTGPPAYQLGKGLANGLYVFSGIDNDAVYVSLTSDPSTPGTWVDGLCHDPGIVQVAVKTDPPPGPQPAVSTPPTPPFSVPGSGPQAAAMLQAAAGRVETDAPDDYVVFAPTEFWIDPQPLDTEDSPAQLITVMGPPDADGISLVYSFSLQVAPSDDVYWDFGDGVTVPVLASTSGTPFDYYYKQISGDGSVPAGGAVVTAYQDVVVTAFVGWTDYASKANYECVLPGGALGGTILGTQTEAETSCGTTYADALVDTPLPAKPVYQVRAIPVA